MCLTLAPPQTNSANRGVGTRPPPTISAAGGLAVDAAGTSGSGSGVNASIRSHVAGDWSPRGMFTGHLLIGMCVQGRRFGHDMDDDAA
jgi:hypothetical protein